MKPRIRRGGGRVMRCRIELLDLPIPAWRVVDVSSRASLQELAAIVEAVFAPLAPWFEVFHDGVRYDGGDDDDPAATTSLDALDLHAGSRLELVSDADDGTWRFAITIETITPRLMGQRLPVLHEGRGRAPADRAVADTDNSFLDLAALDAALARVPRHRPEH